jgi:prepilin-type processing-associated H-X9-DG protein
VVGIIAILLALLLPVVRGARAQSDATACASNLRQLYFAQMFYADEHAGRMAAPKGIALDERWDSRLEKYVNRNPGITAVNIAALGCPSVNPDILTTGQLTFGVNSHLHLPNWQARRAARHNASHIILMGDIPPSKFDQLISEDRFFVDHTEPTATWTDAVNHVSDRIYRHARQTRANMLMSDGHVRQMGRTELLKDSGHWYWGTWELESVEYTGPCCN